jgi:hypothetical protein
MLHLSTDRLAALGDELATPEEAAHLAACAPCATEVSAYRSLLAMAHAERRALGMPLTRWDSISAELAQGGSASLDQSTGGNLRPFARGHGIAARAARWPMQAAAGLLLVAGGLITGRMSAGADALPGRASAAAVVAEGESAALQPVARLSADSAFESVDEARAAQQRSELLYQQAAAFLAQHDSLAGGEPSPVAYRSRLAALDRVISTTREAMRQAPHDPVINGYYITTLGQREATLRQLNTALPASLRVNSF